MAGVVARGGPAPGRVEAARGPRRSTSGHAMAGGASPVAGGPAARPHRLERARLAGVARLGVGRRHVPARLGPRYCPGSMILVGLTGGIGSGKSTVSALLAERGAVIVDADLVDARGAGARPARPRRHRRALRRRAEPDGTLDRAGLAAIVFTDAEALKDLNAIVHPAVRAEIGAGSRPSSATRDRRRRAGRPAAGRGRPLRAPAPSSSWTCPVDVAVERLVDVPGHERGRRPGPHRPPGHPRAAPGGRRPGDRQLGRPGRTGRRRSTSVGLDATLPPPPPASGAPDDEGGRPSPRLDRPRTGVRAR